MGDYTSDPFNIEYGVMQGCNLRPIKFLIYMIDQILQLDKSNWDTILSALGFADDIVFLSNRLTNFQMLIDICAGWSKIIGTSFNMDKCKVMILKTENSTPLR